MATTTTVSTTTNGTHPFIQKTKKILLRILFGVLIVAGLTVSFLMFANYGDGYRVGTIQKLSRKGFVFKTWEGELSQAFLEASPETQGGMATRIWYFTVNGADKEVMTAMDHAIEGNKKVKLYFKEKYTKLPWVGDTRQIVYKVEELP